MSFPLKKTYPLEDGSIDYKYKLQNHEGDLIFNPNTCIECGYCLLACPKQAITLFQDLQLSDDKTRMVDQGKCVQCGVCVYMCTTDALRLEINGEERIILTETEMLPRILGTTVTTPGGQEVRKFVEGTIEVSVEPGTPRGDLELVASSCPTGAMSVNPAGDGIDVDEAKCIYCIRCSVYASRVEGGRVGVKVHRTRVLKDATNWKISAVWNRIIERLLGVKGLSKELQGSIQVKLSDAVLKLNRRLIVKKKQEK
ncbi:MAG: 4Fe-4S dicluster domain-containing protein [Promethearchaeota archaeon]